MARSPSSSGSRTPRGRRRKSSILTDEESSGGADSDVDSEELCSSDEEGGEDNRGFISKARERTLKQKLVAQVLARWWYVLPAWPPPDWDYDKELTERKLRRVGFDQWEVADDVDSDGFMKVYEISHFPGVFRDPKGNAIDLRPMEGRPCFRKFALKTEEELKELLATAIRNQLAQIDQSPYKATDGAMIAKMRADLQNLLLQYCPEQ